MTAPRGTNPKWQRGRPYGSRRAPGGKARGFAGFRLNPDARAEVERLANIETGGNFSAMLRVLLGEALAARRAGQPGSPPPRRDTT